MREKFAERRAKWEASRKGTIFSSEDIGYVFKFTSERLYYSDILVFPSRVCDKIPLRKEVSYDAIETFDQSTDNVISLTIVSYDGRLISLRLLATATIKDVKCKALTELVLPINNVQGTGVLNYKLLKPSENMLDLSESLSISQSELSDYGKRSG